MHLLGLLLTIFIVFINVLIILLINLLIACFRKTAYFAYFPVNPQQSKDIQFTITQDKESRKPNIGKAGTRECFGNFDLKNA